jgi:NAD(P) transhydrogenase subunit alpha
MIIGIPKETFPGDHRVALVPATIPALTKAKLEVVVESGAGVVAGYPDAAYQEKGARLVPDRGEVFKAADVILQVRSLGGNPEAGRGDLERFRRDQAVIGFMDPLGSPQAARDLAGRGAVAFSMELIPRITRAQSMDAQSTMATIAGYKAVLLAAEVLPRIFPMLMTAAGTLTPARVFVIGAGVAGLQAIATAHRLGAVVQAYDVRDAVKDQVKSVGAKFVELPLETGGSETAGGYAKAMDESFYRRQRETMTRVVADSDVVITTAAIPGKKAPVLITADMVRGMPPGSVIVDLAAETGGNCELTKAGQPVSADGVTILGPVNIPATVPYHASQMYSKNIATLLLHLVKEGSLALNLEDEITRETLVSRGGEVVHPRVRELLGLPQAASTGQSNN